MRLETIEMDMGGRIATLEAKIDGKFAELRTDMHKGFADMTKWIVATVLGVGVFSVTIMTFVMNNAVPKAPASSPAPIVVYAAPAAGPAPPAAAPSPVTK
jgi:roadblock/LC7 domain-containing protein